MQKPLPNPQSKQHVIVGMSGGVDSAVAALLLRDAGYSVQALFMSNWEDDDGYCTTASDFQDARRVSETLQIPLHRVSFAGEYRDRVFSHFLREYAAGRTPNPDVLCNREIKFGICLSYMQRLGAAWMATGHYARIRRAGSHIELLKAADTAKDQSYFLHGVAASALSKTLFPLGGMRKAEVRRIAHAAGLPVFDKPDSTGICFIGERPFQDFLSRHLHTTPGPIETPEGRVLGEHRGLALYTLGQRSGLKIGGRAGAAAAPWYVAAKIIERNALVVVQDQYHPLLLSDEFSVEQMHWIDPADAPAHAIDCAVKTRYRQNDLSCSLRSSGAASWRVTLEHPARAVTPGQYAVFYDGERCLGGGIIARRFNFELAPEARGIPYNSLFSVEGP
ncbi:MAG TPA: tRNA 2-thiouridine(34) synthase MnmA [Steroidobacteraceae bacterium]|jgi:tRNA-specific 2-thiouridylase|nr:tRNA 2-thiouridine(34) synthase MnmA [Steroidobacteraceae bacterium]